MIKELLLEQFNACYDRNGWFVAVKNAIEGLSAEQANWKPDGSANSIWETIGHLTFYNYAYLERFKGVDYQYPTDDNDETFAAGHTDEQWVAAVNQFNSAMNEWRDLISAADEGKLLSNVSPTRTDPWWSLISHINTHNAYHGGQILLLRKLQGSWNPDKGVS